MRYYLNELLLKNGGVFENEFINLNGKTMQRYWIDTRLSLIHI